MKSFKKAFIFLFIILFSQSLFAQTQLCNYVYNFLKQNNCNPKTQQLVASVNNNFPYNLSANFDSKNTEETDFFSIKKNLYLIFNQEDVEKNEESFKFLFNFLKENIFNFNVSLVFLYGENQLIEKEIMVYGSQVFLQNINTNEDSTAIIFNLNNEQNTVVTASKGISSPSWLIKNIHDILSNQQIKSNLPFYYISQLYNYEFNYNRQLNSFFEMNIPSILVNLNSNQLTSEQLSNIFNNSITQFSKTLDSEWDQHSLMINAAGKYLRMTESTIVKIIIFILLFFLLFIALLRFINKTFQKTAWKKIKEIWYVVPLTFVIVLISLFFGKLLFALFFNHSQNKNLFTLCGIQLSVTFIFTTLYYVFQILHNKNFEPGVIDYPLAITIFLNQFIFLFKDVSLFPLFMFICIISIFTLLFRNNYVHTGLLIITILSFSLYVNSLLHYSNISDLFDFIYSHNLVNVMLTLVLYPIFLMYFRILCQVYFHKSSRKNLYISSSAVSLAAILLICFLGIITTKRFIKPAVNINPEIIQSTDSDIKITYSDKKVFDDIIRTININLPSPSLQCEVLVKCEDGNPILYSSDDYILNGNNTSSFLIPYNPPSILSFSYGTSELPSTIIVKSISEQFSLSEKSITIR